MKRIFFLLLFLLTISLPSCVMDNNFLFVINHEEIIQVNPGGKGVYFLKLDLDDFLKESLSSMEQGSVDDYKLMKVDTTILFNKLLAKASLHMTEKKE